MKSKSSRTTFDNYVQSIPVTETYRVAIEQLIARRQELGYSQEYLSDTIGCTTSLVHKWERYKRVPSGFMFSCWLDALDCQVKISPKETEAG